MVALCEQYIHETRDLKSTEHDNSNKTNDDDSSNINDNSVIPIVNSKTESSSNNSITLPDSQNQNSEHSYQISSTELPKKSQEPNTEMPKTHGKQ